jgi:hypothetical protein
LERRLCWEDWLRSVALLGTTFECVGWRGGTESNGLLGWRVGGIWNVQSLQLRSLSASYELEVRFEGIVNKRKGKESSLKRACYDLSLRIRIREEQLKLRGPPTLRWKTSQHFSHVNIAVVLDCMLLSDASMECSDLKAESALMPHAVQQTTPQELLLNHNTPAETDVKPTNPQFNHSIYPAEALHSTSPDTECHEYAALA